MTASYHQYLVWAFPADHPHLFQAILSNVLKTKVGITNEQKFEKILESVLRVEKLD